MSIYFWKWFFHKNVFNQYLVLAESYALIDIQICFTKIIIILTQIKIKILTLIVYMKYINMCLHIIRLICHENEMQNSKNAPQIPKLRQSTKLYFLQMCSVTIILWRIGSIRIWNKFTLRYLQYPELASHRILTAQRVRDFRKQKWTIASHNNYEDS